MRNGIGLDYGNNPLTNQNTDGPGKVSPNGPDTSMAIPLYTRKKYAPDSTVCLCRLRLVDVLHGSLQPGRTIYPTYPPDPPEVV